MQLLQLLQFLQSSRTRDQSRSSSPHSKSARVGIVQRTDAVTAVLAPGAVFAIRVAVSALGARRFLVGGRLRAARLLGRAVGLAVSHREEGGGWRFAARDVVRDLG